MLAVPFENLTIHLGGQNVLDPDVNFAKIVDQRRGGWCFELNGTFARLLEALGFEVTRLAAGVWNDDSGEYSSEFAHLCLRVDLDEPWLVDVGFGENFTTPLRLQTGLDQPRDRFVYRLKPDGERLVVLRDGEPQYRFALTPRTMDAYRADCVRLQTTVSGFTKAPRCSMALPNGRITMNGLTAIETLEGERREWELADEVAQREFLRERFGVVVDGPFRPPALSS
jgi:N-hydroxyarylamine O-acetyltransferase